MVYVCADDWKLYAFDSTKRTKLWEFPVDPGSSPVPVIGIDGEVYVSAGTSRRKMYALDGKTGRKLWEFDAGWVIESAPAVDSNGRVFFGRVGVWEPSGRYFGRIYGLDGKVGNKIWDIAVPDSVTDSPVLDLDGTLFVANRAMDSGTGVTKWITGSKSRKGQTPALTAIGLVYAEDLAVVRDVGSPAIGADGTVLFGARSISYVEGKGDGAFFYAMDQSTGTKRWEEFFPFATWTSGGFFGTPAIGSDGVVYVGFNVGSNIGKLYALDGENGAKLGEFTVGGNIESSPTLLKDGRLFFGCNDGFVYVVMTTSRGLADSPWPMFRANPQHTGVRNRVSTPPKILSHPKSQTVLMGGSVTLSVTATGTIPLRYQWRKDGVNLSGATNGNYTIANIRTSHAGTYMVVVSNEGGSTSSLGAELTVIEFTATPMTYTFSTLAGSPGSIGSADGTGSAARFYSPSGVAVDNAGNLYVVDSTVHTIRKITPAGAVTTLAGLALNQGNADGIGSGARFLLPTGVAVDNAGNVYVADTGNGTIRKVTPTAVVTTLAGLAGNSGSADGTGSAARFYLSFGVAVDNAGTVYVADSGNHTIRKITPNGSVSTLAGLALKQGSADGTGAVARFNFPSSLAVDSVGNVYVADRDNHTIRKIRASGEVSTIAGMAGNANNADGTGSAARFYSPSGVAVDNAGNLYVVDSTVHTIRKIMPNGAVSTLGGLASSKGSADGTGSAARFNVPSDVAVDGSGNLYVTDGSNHTIRKGVPSIIGAATALELTGITRMSNGGFRVSLKGQVGKNLTLLGSSNLVNWLPLAILPNPQGTVQFDDPPAANLKQRFYRAASQ